MKTDFASYLDKIDRLDELNSTGKEKAVFVGGSATHFGVIAEKFQTETGINSVNMGLNAGVSFDLYIDSVLPYLNAGDYLFIIPEYDYYTWNNRDTLGQSSINFICYYQSNLIKDLSAKRLFMSIPNLLDTGWSGLGSSLTDLIKNSLFGSDYGIYYRSNSNEYGDFINKKEKWRKNISVEHMAEDDDSFEYFQSYLENVIKLCESEGIHTYLCYPPYYDESYFINIDLISKIYKGNILRDFPILTTPQDSIYSKEMFFDSTYHLDDVGANQYTEMLINKFLINGDLNGD